MTTTPTLDQLKRGLAISEQIAALEAEMAAIFSGSAPAKAASTAKAAPMAHVKKKGGMSPEGRARVAAAQKARWAKIKGKKPAAASKAPAKAKAEAPVKKKRKPMSPEHKAKLVVAAKARWAAAKAGKGPAPTASKKK